MRWLLLAIALIGCATAPVSQKPIAHGEECPPKADAAQSAKSFDHYPKAGEAATCPVSGESFVVDANTIVREYQGKYYAFCCGDCVKDFHPEQGQPDQAQPKL